MLSFPRPRRLRVAFALAIVTAPLACAPGVPPKAPNAASAPPAPASAPPAAASTPLAGATRVTATAAATSGYDQPPQPLLDVLRSPPPPVPSMSPTGDRLLLTSWVEFPPIARVAEPYLRLAGVRLEPRSRAKHDTPGGYGIRPCVRAFGLVSVATGAEVSVALPAGACPGRALWSADGTRLAFENVTADAVELWIADAATGAARRVDGVRLNPMLGSAVQWTSDQKALLVKLVPADAGAPPAKPASSGPSVQESLGEKGESSTYETRDTLTSKHDEALFDYYAAAELAVVDAATLQVRRVGKPDLYVDLDAAPDGVHVLAHALRKPYSYVTTYERFGREIAVIDLQKGDRHVVATLPLADRVPVHGVPVGPREHEWRPTEPATLVWAEALDRGDWKVKVPARDRVLLQRAPFSSPPVEIARTEQRFEGFTWGESRDLAFLKEHDENRHWDRTFTMNVDDPQAKPRLLWDLSSDEHYAHPGALVLRRLANGAWVARQEGDAVYLAGEGASETGDRPFLDRLDLKSRRSERLFRSERSAYERFLAFTSTPRAFVTWHQSPTDPPNAFVRTLASQVPAAAGEPAFTSEAKALTRMADPTPAVRAIKKRLVKYKRKDGTDLSFTLYTPPGYREGTRVPAILYAYPLDYADPKQAGQVTGSEQTFTRLRPYRLMLLAGYAVIDNAAFPIVGDPRKAYDTYLEQLVADATAAVDKAVEIGVVDRARVGITGHSHGALMTANLLAHSELFRAGVATSGSYNKTLTPFGFQNERRSVWEAQKVYLQASTFFFADRLKKPILIMHGEEDANPGTTPLQARKLYEAIRGNGGVARLVMLPHEPHWYTAIESNEQLVAEMLRWFDRYVKGAPPAAAPAR